MSKYDLRVVGPSHNREYRVASGATAILVGEPVNSLSALTSGASDVNTAVVLTDGKPIIGTDNFLGIAAKASTHTASVAGRVNVSVIYPSITEIWGAAKSAAAIDTDAELLAILFDAVLFDLTSSVYTIDSAAAGNTSGLTIIDGNIAAGELGVTVDARVLRKSVS
jgi:hypothetical protein